MRRRIMASLGCLSVAIVSICLNELVLSAADSQIANPVSVHEFMAKDFRGKEWTLSDFRDSQFLVCVFVGTECPLAKLYGSRLAEMAAEYESRGVAFIGVSSNRQDSMTELASYARRHGIEFPILKDLSNEIADQFGAKRTPEVFVLDQQHEVRYRGRIDDQFGVGYVLDKPGRRDLAVALDELLAGKTVSVPSTTPVGCIIGRLRDPDNESPVTYCKQIARILQDRCIECHRPGEVAPFALTEYEEVVGWSEMIAEVVVEGRMPPWHADPHYGEFSNDRRLGDDEKEQILDWVRHGCRKGKKAICPRRANSSSDRSCRNSRT